MSLSKMTYKLHDLGVATVAPYSSFDQQDQTFD